jgi:hypothetical protein
MKLLPVKTKRASALGRKFLLGFIALITYCNFSMAQSGAALHFDGADDRVNLGTTMNATLDAASAVTVEAWVYPTDADAFGCIIGNYSTVGNGSLQFLLRRDGNGFTFWVDLGSGFSNVTTGNVVAFNTWQHVAGVWNSATQNLQIYVDGVLQGTTSSVVGTTLSTNGSPFMVGWNSINEQMTGALDEVRVWTRALCQSEIVNNKNCEIATTGTGLLANYHFNQGLASLNNAGITSLTDASGNGNNGTLMNFTLNGGTSNWIAPGGVASGTTCSAFSVPSVTVTPVSQINVACFGGSNGAATVSASGGSGLTYNWTPGNPTGDGTASVTGLTAGTWTCTVTNNCGGTGTATFTITQPSAPVSGSSVVTNVACFGGSNGAINLTPTGGTPGYTYNWGGGITTQDRTGLTAGAYTVVITDANGCTGTVTATVTQPTSPVSGTTVVTNVACFGGSNGAINLTPSGGTGPYTFNWLPSGPTTEDRTGLTAGTFTVQITDVNGCTGTVNATVTQPTTPVSGTTVVTNVACFGGSNGAINLTPSGGTGPYTFNWLPSGPTTEDRTGLTAGTFTVQITDVNGCTGTVTATVTQPTSPVSGTTVVTNVACFGGSNGAINLTPSGGTGPYTFNWLPSGPTTEDRTGLTAGTFTVQITDVNGCTVTVTATVTQPTSPVSGTTVVTNVACFGGSNGAINLTPSGGTGPYTFNWLPSGPTTEDRTGLTAGTFTVQITDVNGCTVTVTATVTQPTSPVSGTTVVTNVACFGGSNGAINLTPSGGTGPYTFNWLPSGPTTEDRTGLTAGTFTVQITDVNGCTGTVTATVTQPTSPVSGTTVVTNVACFGGSNGAINLTPSGGTGPYTFNWLPSGPTTEDRTGLTAGTFTVQITDVNGCTGTVTATVTEPTDLIAISSATTILCNGGTATVTVSAMDGTAPYTGTGTFTVSAGTHSYTVTDANGCTATTNITVTEPTDLMAISSATTILCNGGTATVTVSAMDGTASYTGTGTFTVSAGTHSYTVTDANGCTATTNITVTEPTDLMAISSATTILCNGGTATVTVSAMDGTAPYTGTGTFTVSAGTHTYTVTDANGCTAITNITVTEPSTIGSSVTTTNSNCGNLNGTATVNAAGGTGTLTYLWSSSGTAATETGLAAGSYTVTITDDNSCTATNVASISDIGAPTVTTISADASCNGTTDASVDNTVSGGTGVYTYSWSNLETTEDITGISAGTYSYTVTDDAGCQATGSVTISEPAAIDVTTSSMGITIAAINSTATSYQWMDCGNNTIISGETAQSFTALANGDYAVIITEGTCVDTSACVNVTTIGMNESASVNSFSIYPNPASELIAIEINANMVVTAKSINVYNVIGKLVYSVQVISERTEISLDGLAAGIYVVKLNSTNGIVAKRLIKN